MDLEDASSRARFLIRVRLELLDRTLIWNQLHLLHALRDSRPAPSRLPDGR